MTDTARLKALAQAAMPASAGLSGTWPEESAARTNAVRDFRKAAHPQAVLDLIAEVERLTETIADFVRANAELAVVVVDDKARIATLESEIGNAKSAQIHAESHEKEARERTATLEAALREIEQQADEADDRHQESNEEWAHGYCAGRDDSAGIARRALDGGEK